MYEKINLIKNKIYYVDKEKIKEYYLINIRNIQKFKKKGEGNNEKYWKEFKWAFTLALVT